MRRLANEVAWITVYHDGVPQAGVSVTLMAPFGALIVAVADTVRHGEHCGMDCPVGHSLYQPYRVI